MGTTSPIDGWHAWVVLVGCFVINLLSSGYDSCFWLLFLFMQHHYDYYESWYEPYVDVTSAMLVVRVIVQSVSAFVATNVLLEMVSERVVVVLGGVLLGVSVSLTCLAPNMTVAILSSCVVAGTGQGFLYGPGVVVLAQYFCKHRPLAMVVASFGWSVGILAFPPLVQYLIVEFTWRGTSIILGAILLNTAALGALYRPLPLAKVLRAQRASQALLREEDDEGEGEGVELPLLRVDVGDPEHSVCIEHGSDVMAARGSPSKSEEDPDAPGHHSASDPRPESPGLPAPPASPDTAPRSLTQSPGRRHILARIAAVCGFPLFKRPLFLAILFCSIRTGVISDSGFVLRNLALEKEMSYEEVSFMMALIGVLSFVGRLGVGVLANLRRVAAHSIAAASFLLLGVACQLTRLYVSFPLLVLFSVLYGLLGGAYFVLLPIIIIDFLGLQSLAKTIGFVQLLMGISYAAMYPLLGPNTNISSGMIFNIAGTGSLLAFAALVVGSVLRECRKTAQWHAEDASQDCTMTHPEDASQDCTVTYAEDVCITRLHSDTR